MSKRSEKRSTIFPLPSSPHWEPRMITFPILSKPIYCSVEANRQIGSGIAPFAPGMITYPFMEISDVYLGLGQEGFSRLVRGISIGKLRTFQIYEGFKVRAHLTKVNTEALRKSAPRFWDRIMGGDQEFGRDLAQSVLVSHLDLIGAVLDFLGVPHENGFFAKDIDPKPYFTEGWEDRVFEKFRVGNSEPLVLFYINHLRWEMLGATE